MLTFPSVEILSLNKYSTLNVIDYKYILNHILLFLRFYLSIKIKRILSHAFPPYPLSLGYRGLHSVPQTCKVPSPQSMSSLPTAQHMPRSLLIPPSCTPLVSYHL
jgi:hypothetical protein